METTSLIPGMCPRPRNCALSSQHQPVGLSSLKQSALESSDSNSGAIPNSRLQMNTQRQPLLEDNFSVFCGFNNKTISYLYST